MLLVGDTLMIGPSGHTVSFMRSYPNLLPLSERLVRQIVAAMEPLAYDRIYGAFPGRMIERADPRSSGRRPSGTSGG